MSRTSSRPEVRRLQATRAGIVSRAIADGIDLLVVILLGAGTLLALTAVRALFTRNIEWVGLPQAGRGILAGVLLVAYLGCGWGLGGRTLGKAVMGLRVVRDDGSDVSLGHGLLRAVLYVLVLPGFLWAGVSRRNAALQDLVLRTSVVHDWGFAPTGHGPDGAAGGAEAGTRTRMPEGSVEARP